MLHKNNQSRWIVPLPQLSFLEESQWRKKQSTWACPTKRKHDVNFTTSTTITQTLRCATTQEQSEQVDCSAPTIVIPGRITVAEKKIHLGMPQKKESCREFHNMHHNYADTSLCYYTRTIRAGGLIRSLNCHSWKNHSGGKNNSPRPAPQKGSMT
jgi:hypothetical protein